MDTIFKRLLYYTMSMTSAYCYNYQSWHGLTSPPLIDSFKGYTEIYGEHGTNFNTMLKSTNDQKS